VRRVPQLLAVLAGALVAALALGAGGAPSAEAATLAQVGDFTRPVYVMAPPRDTRNVFVVERGGTVRLLVDGVRRARPFLDISGLVAASTSRESERGLLSIAFAPDYLLSGRFYVYYTSQRPPAARTGDIAIDEFRRSATDPEVADPATRRPILAIDHDDYENHNGGQLAFGPDGALYAGTGDGGGAGDPLGSGQAPESLLGKLLRLEPIGGGTPAVWSSGLRNPFRFSFDRLTGDLSIGDVGQGDVEEIDFASKASRWGRGANFGWNLLEGSTRYGAGRLATPGELPGGYVAPVIEHPHSEGWCSITGGYVVRDPALPELLGRYVYGDYCKGELYGATLSPAGATGVGPVGLRVAGLSSLGEDGCGRLYAASIDGPVYRLAASGACAGPAPVPFAVPGDGPAGSPAGSPGDGHRPKVRLRVPPHQKVLRQGFLRAIVACNELCRVAASGKLLDSRATTRTTLQRVRRTLAERARIALKLPVSRPARRTLHSRFARRPTALARVTVIARDGTGNRRVVTTLALLAR
jgi:hypothetical protein